MYDLFDTAFRLHSSRVAEAWNQYTAALHAPAGEATVTEADGFLQCLRLIGLSVHSAIADRQAIVQRRRLEAQKADDEAFLSGIAPRKVELQRQADAGGVVTVQQMESVEAESGPALIRIESVERALRQLRLDRPRAFNVGTRPADPLDRIGQLEQAALNAQSNTQSVRTA